MASSTRSKCEADGIGLVFTKVCVIFISSLSLSVDAGTRDNYKAYKIIK